MQRSKTALRRRLNHARLGMFAPTYIMTVRPMVLRAGPVDVGGTLATSNSRRRRGRRTPTAGQKAPHLADRTEVTLLLLSKRLVVIGWHICDD